MNPDEHLSPEERLRRIGELLSKGVTMLLEAERNAPQKAGEAAVAAKVEETERDDITRAIVAFLKRVGWATPQKFCRALDVKRATCFRRLKVGGGLLEKRRKTSGAQYRILVKGQSATPAAIKAAVVYHEPSTPAAMIRAGIEAMEKQTARNWQTQRDEALRSLRGAAEWVEGHILHEKQTAFARQ